jgi:hypothetical protein
MSIQARPAHRFFRDSASRSDARTDNRLAFIDQAMFLGARATGQELAMQSVWLYEHPVDFDQLRRFHRNFGYGLAGRLIETSPLPFGRHRWVSSLGPPSDIDIAECPRPRAELGDWADECAQLPIDPELGPGWRLGVLPLTDGSTAVSLVVSHSLADGVGALLAVVDAVKGNTCDLGYPPPRSRTRLRAVVTDTRETAASAPEVARTLVAAARLARRRRRDNALKGAPRSAAIIGDGGDQPVVVPAINIFVDVEDWDARAEALGGNSYSMVAGLAAKFAERMGRLRADDGAASLIVPINDRTLEDTRANAVVLAHVSIDPTQVTTDLSSTRIALKQALKTAREVPDETLQLLPLIPLIPKRAVERLADVAFGLSADLPVSCSNLGELPPEIGRPDGTDAEYVVLRGIDRRVTRQVLEQRRGLLTLVSGRVGPKISIAVIAYQPGGKNSKSHLREMAAHTLAEFGLAGVIID